MNLAAAQELRTYRVFISSADTQRLRALRDRVESLIRELVNEQLGWANAAFRFETMRWEAAASQRVDSEVIRLFVDQALQSQLTIVLFVDDIRPGTKKELLAVLNHEPERIEVAVLRFSTKSERRSNDDALGKYLKWLRSRYSLVIRTVNHPNDDADWSELVRTTVAALIGAYQNEVELRRERFDETR